MINNLLDRVYMCECWARDGLQSIEKLIPTKDKIRIINKFSRAGYARIEVTSFSNPKIVLQFADAEQVLAGIERLPGVSYKTTCVNARALERAIAAKQNGFGPDEVSFVVSVSEAFHNLVNGRMTHEEHWEQITAMAKRAIDNDLRIIAMLLTAFGCPLSGDVQQGKVIEFVQRYVDLGATWVGLGDTTGMGNPTQVIRLFHELLERFPTVTFIAHFHDTRGTGLANSMAAYNAGVRYFDAALGGIGGQPAGGEKYHVGFTGNTCSEDLACMFEEMGIRTGISPEAIVALGLEAEEILGDPQRSQVIRCGVVNHGSKTIT